MRKASVMGPGDAKTASSTLNRSNFAPTTALGVRGRGKPRIGPQNTFVPVHLLSHVVKSAASECGRLRELRDGVSLELARHRGDVLNLDDNPILTPYDEAAARLQALLNADKRLTRSGANSSLFPARSWFLLGGGASFGGDQSIGSSRTLQVMMSSSTTQERDHLLNELWSALEPEAQSGISRLLNRLGRGANERRAPLSGAAQSDLRGPLVDSLRGLLQNALADRNRRTAIDVPQGGELGESRLKRFGSACMVVEFLLFLHETGSVEKEVGRQVFVAGGAPVGEYGGLATRISRCAHRSLEAALADLADVTVQRLQHEAPGLPDAAYRAAAEASGKSLVEIAFSCGLAVKPRGRGLRRLVLEPVMLPVLVAGLIEPGESLRLEEFVEKLAALGLVVGPAPGVGAAQLGLRETATMGGPSRLLRHNMEALRRRLVLAGLARTYSDGYTEVGDAL